MYDNEGIRFITVTERDEMSMNTGFRAMRLSRKYLEGIKAAGKKLSINMIGMVYVDDDVTTDLIEETVSSVSLYGRIIAKEPDVRQSLQSLNTA